MMDNPTHEYREYVKESIQDIKDTMKEGFSSVTNKANEAITEVKALDLRIQWTEKVSSRIKK